MKRITVIVFFLAAWTPFRLAAADCELLLTPWVDAAYTQIPNAAQSYMETKLGQMITVNGIGIGASGGQFALLAKCDILSKDVLGGAPIVQTQRMSITFFIADMIDEKILASTNVEVVSSGSSEAQTYINAIRRLNVNDRKIQDMIRLGKERIMAYYDSNTDAIIKKAQNLAMMNANEQALFLLVSIPECSPKYDAVVAACGPIYQAVIDRECQQNLMAAKLRWAASQTARGASEAGDYMMAIEPGASCFGDAVALYNEMKSSITEDVKFKYRVYEDLLSLERERLSVNREVTLESIKAYRDVGVAWGNSQQPTTVLLERLRR